MAPSFTISNRQRKHSLKAFDLPAMAGRIGLEVCRNLTENRCDWLSPTQIASIESSGIFSLVLVSDKKIQELNKQWRGKNQPTDVLSFPLDLEPDPDMDSIPFEVGEIIISVDKARAQSEEYGHSLERELAFLITHGVLHILGFDHQTEEEEKDMFGRQRQVLDKLGYTRR